MEQLQAQRRHTQSMVNKGGGDAWNRQLQQIRGAIKGFKPAAPAPTPVASPPVTASDPNAGQSTVTPATATGGSQSPSILFPDVNSFLPETIKASPLYKFQRDKALEGADAYYASRGLTGSGAEITGRSEIETGLVGQEANRLQGLAQTNADRYATIQENDAMRRERNSNEAFNRLYSILGLTAQQNPISYASSGYNTYADMLNNIYKSCLLYTSPSPRD